MHVEERPSLNTSPGTAYWDFTITDQLGGPVDYKGNLRWAEGSPKRISFPNAEASSPADMPSDFVYGRPSKPLFQMTLAYSLADI